MTTRTIDRYTMSTSLVEGYGYLRDAIVSTPGGCPSTLMLPFSWPKAVSAFSGGEQTDMATVRSFLASYVAAAGCEGLPSTDAAVAHYYLGLGGGGVAGVNLRITLNIKLFAGGGVVTRETWSAWYRPIGFFTSGEQSQLQALVSMFTTKVNAEQPLS